MKINSPYSKSKNEIEDLKVTKHKEYDKNGKKVTNSYVEFMIIGKNRSWKNFMSIKEFKKLNPKIKI